MRLARQLLRDDTAADDLAQEALMVAHRAPPDPARPARRWLTQVLRNAVRMPPRRGRFAVVRIPLAGLFILVAVASPARAEQPATLPTFDLRSDEIFNLVYHLECLAAGEGCPFEALWKQRLGWTPEDEQSQKLRRQIRGRYTGSISVDADADDAPFMFDAPRVVEIKKKLMIAAAGARSVAEYRDRLSLVVMAADASRIAAETERFLPRFHRWFREARTRVPALTREVRDVLDDVRVRQVVEQAMRFYEVPATQSRQIAVQLVPLPPDWNGPTRGEQIEHLSTIEVGGGQQKGGTPRPRGKTGAIALHELFHAFYASAPGARARALAASLAAATDPGAAAAYGLLNEGLATALAAMSLRAYLGPKDFQAHVDSGARWYGEPAIDMAGRAAFPVVEETLARGGTLYDPAFVPAYVRALRARADAALDRPALKLRTLVMAGEDPELRPAMRRISSRAVSGRALSAIPLETPQLKDAWQKHGEQSGVLLVRGRSLEKLRPYEPILGAKIVERLGVLRRQHGAFVHTVRRARHSSFYVVVADDVGAMEALADRLMTAVAPFDVLTLSSPDAARDQ